MKKLYVLGLALSLGMAAFAQNEYNGAIEFEEVYFQKISPAGTLLGGQDPIGSYTVGYNVTTGQLDYYPACYPGDGNCLSDNGIMVGQEMQMTGMFAAMMKDGETIVTDALKEGGYSIFHAITPDGTRACGYIANLSNVGPIFSPFFCDISPNGEIGRPVRLPCPDKDFFGDRAQYVIAGCISADGKTIGGLVIDGSGGYSWPIIFREDENHRWSYSQPTEVLFNPNNEEMPANPDDEANGPAEPLIRDYMTPENYAAYMQRLQDEPYFNQYWEYMSDDEYNKYIEDHMRWAGEYSSWWEKAFREYQAAMRRMGSEQHFGGILHISPDGKTLLTAKNGVPYEFNLEDDSFAPLGINTAGLTITQLLGDGTLVGCSMAGGVPYEGYICPAGDDKFMKATDYLAEHNPDYYNWLDDSFLHVNDVMITGVLIFSEDLQTVCGGYMDGDGGAFSYLFKPEKADDPDDPEESAVETILAEDEILNVYNLNGIQVMTTKDASELSRLPQGLYIINGKKVVL